mmetsp:Transcript_5414/g.5569  ORF Transcript_5414/g.5569 Transcript_5414/m.5569 type:complete len:758 (+) Transcript_5414:101-2374(+)
MTDFSDFQYLDDFKEIESFIEKDAEGFEIPFDAPEFVPDFGSAIIVDNIPVIGPERMDKLKGVLTKLYSQINPAEEFKPSDIYMPFDDVTKQSLGFCFIKFKSKEDADKAVQVTQGFQLDKKHHFNVTLYADLEKYSSVPDEYVPPEPVPFHPRPNPLSWLTDPLGRDQFVLRFGEDTQIVWASLIQGEDPVLVYGGEREKQAGKNWTEMSVQWSPQGTFLATFHPQGVKLWGGEQFEAQGRFIHPYVETIEFSPCEEYLITCRFDQSHSQNPMEAIIVWSVRDCKKLRSFDLKSPLDAKFQVSTVVADDKQGKQIFRPVRGRVVEYSADYGTFRIAEGNVIHENVPMEKVQPLQDPNRLKWSPDGRFVARMGCDNIIVYELPSMALLDKKSIAAKDVLDFVWSPKSCLISYWSPAVGNYPAIINIIELPGRKDVCSRKVFDVQDGQMVWQSEGDFLCVHMTKTQNKKRTYVMMVFRVREPEVPVEILELTEPILHMSWEPGSERFATVTGDVRSPTVSFYTVGGVGPSSGAVKGVKPRKELVLLFSLSGKQCNEVIWSPAGGVVAIVYYAPDSCLFDLHDVDSNALLASRRHDRCNRLVWDPSGRMIASATLSQIRSSNVRGHSEDGVNIYTFQGTLLCQCRREKLYQMQWRPRPTEVLSSEERKKIIKNLRKYEKMFDKEDDARREQLDSAIVAYRRKLATEFLDILWQRQRELAKYKQQRVDLRDGYDSDDDRYYDVEVQVEETILNTKEQIIH